MNDAGAGDTELVPPCGQVLVDLTDHGEPLFGRLICNRANRQCYFAEFRAQVNSHGLGQ
jgi:hypothetical protein